MEKTRQILAMEKLGMTDEEIKEVLECDKKIDKGEKLFELGKAQEQASKQSRQVAKAPTVYKFETRERKADTDKREIMEMLKSAISGNGAELVEMVNIERELTFTKNGRNYKIVLSCPRGKK